MGGMVIRGGAHTISFNNQSPVPLGAGDIFTYYVRATNDLKRSLLQAADQPAMS